jgi:hypothetical protein
MATNKLMEAAADILSGSKSRATSMPPQKLDGEVVDLGGPTPQNYKPDDDSAKIHATKGAKSATAPTTHPSAASSAMPSTSMKKEESETEDDDDIYLEYVDQLNEAKRMKVMSKAGNHIGTITHIKRDNAGNPYKSVYHDDEGYNAEAWHPTPEDATKYIHNAHKRDKNRVKRTMKNLTVQEDIDSLFADDSTISEEFKSKAATIFEARVFDRVSQIQEQIESEYASMLEEAVEIIKEDLTTKVDDYLNYIVEQWLEQNEIAIESGLRSELTEEFIAGLRNLFAEHYIDVPSEKVDLVDELAGKVEELEGKLSEEIERSVEYKKALVEAVKLEIARDVCGSLTETQVEKIKSLAESVEFSTEEEYKEKLETIRENYFPSGIKKADEQHLHEQVEDTEEKKPVYDPFVAAVTQAISKTKLQ